MEMMNSPQKSVFTTLTSSKTISDDIDEKGSGDSDRNGKVIQDYKKANARPLNSGNSPGISTLNLDNESMEIDKIESTITVIDDIPFHDIQLDSSTDSNKKKQSDYIDEKGNDNNSENTQLGKETPQNQSSSENLPGTSKVNLEREIMEIDKIESTIPCVVNDVLFQNIIHDSSTNSTTERQYNRDGKNSDNHFVEMENYMSYGFSANICNKTAHVESHEQNSDEVLNYEHSVNEKIVPVPTEHFKSLREMQIDLEIQTFNTEPSNSTFVDSRRKCDCFQESCKSFEIRNKIGETSLIRSCRDEDANSFQLSDSNSSRNSTKSLCSDMQDHHNVHVIEFEDRLSVESNHESELDPGNPIEQVQNKKCGHTVLDEEQLVKSYLQGKMKRPPKKTGRKRKTTSKLSATKKSKEILLPTLIADLLQISHPNLRFNITICRKIEVFIRDIIYRIGEEAEKLMTMSERKNFTPRVLKYAIKLSLEEIKKEADVAAGRKTPWLF